MNDLDLAFDAFLSPINKIRNDATEYFFKQIKENPLFFKDLFIRYNVSPNLVHKKLSLILIKTLILNNFLAIHQNFQPFSEILLSSISNTNNSALFCLLSEIVYQISLKIEDNWMDLPEYLTLYRKNINLLPFSLFLYRRCLFDRDIYNKYQQLLQEIQIDILLQGFQCKDVDMQIITSNLFCFIIRNDLDKDNIPNEVQTFCSYLLTIAQNSIDFSEIHFNNFWTSILKLNPIVSHPFYLLAQNIFTQRGPILSPHAKSILFSFILYNNLYIQKEDIDQLMKIYFLLQLEVEDVDNKCQAFHRLKFVDEDIAYKCFMDNIYSFMTNPNHGIQKVGLIILDSFIMMYPSYLEKNITMFIDIMLPNAFNSDDNIFYTLKFIEDYLSEDNQLNYSDTLKVFDFLFTVLLSTPCDTQYQAYQGLKSLNYYLEIYDKLIGISSTAIIPPSILPLYLSLLLHSHVFSANMTFVKYEKFIDYVIDIFWQVCKQIAENKSNLEIIFDLLLIRGSAANLLFYYSFYNPMKLSSFVQPIIESFLDLLSYEETPIFEKCDRFTVYEVINDFVYICNLMKNQTIQFLQPYYDKLIDFNNTEEILFIFCKVDGMGCPIAECYAEAFYKNISLIFSKQVIDFKKFSSLIVHFVPNLTGWAYKVPGFRYHDIFIQIIFILFKNFMNSPQLFDVACFALLNMVKPKHVLYNQNNEWYSKIILKANKIVNYVIQSLDSMRSGVFLNTSLMTLMRSFIYLQNDSGHIFFSEFIVPYYIKNQVAFERHLLFIFIDMLKNNYCTKDEIVQINSIIKEIINRGNLYIDNRALSFVVVSYLLKAAPEIANEYLQFVMNQFQQLKNDPSAIDLCFSYSYFLLLVINQNQNMINVTNELLHDIFACWPNSYYCITSLFLDEILLFAQNNYEKMSKEIIESLLTSFGKYLSYQTYTTALLKTTVEKYNQVVELFKSLLNIYCQNVPETDPVSVVTSILPEQPNSIQFVLSLIA